MTLIKRADKGEALTYEELDGNFTHLGGDGSYQFPATDGLAGQVLTTDGNGNLTFQSGGLPELITADFKGSVFADDSTLIVDGLNGSVFASSLRTQDETIVLGSTAGDTGQLSGGIAIGFEAGETNQSTGGIFASHASERASVAIGYQEGKTSQLSMSVAIGSKAGSFNQDYSNVAVGWKAQEFKYLNAGMRSVAIGAQAAEFGQSLDCVAIGYSAGKTTQGRGSIAIGSSAGSNNQGDDCIAIGKSTAGNNQPDETLIISADTGDIFPSGSGEAYISPIREVTGGTAPAGFSPMYYNPTTKEVIVVSP